MEGFGEPSSEFSSEPVELRVKLLYSILLKYRFLPKDDEGQRDDGVYERTGFRKRDAVLRLRWLRPDTGALELIPPQFL